MEKKISELIREGVKKDGRQIFGHYFEYESAQDGGLIRTNIIPIERRITGCCVMGAIMIAADTPRGRGFDFERNYPEFHKFCTTTDCPICPFKSGVTVGLVHLNDDHRWTREQIADYFEAHGF